MGGSASGNTEPPTPPRVLAAPPPLPAGTVAGAGGSSSGPPGAAPAVTPIAGAAPSPADPSKVLPELGPPRANTGKKIESAETAPATNSGPPNAPPPSSGTVSKTATGDGGGDGQGDDDPFLRATPTPKLPKASRPPPALRPARLSGDRDWIVFVECKTEGVVIYPTHLLIPASARPRFREQSVAAIRAAIDRPETVDGAARRRPLSS